MRGQVFPLHRSEYQEMFQSIGVSEEAWGIFEQEQNIQVVLVKRLPAWIANILKQECLSVGADAAIHKESVRCRVDLTDALLFGTARAYRSLVPRLRVQALPSLTRVARELSEILQRLHPVQSLQSARKRALDYTKGALVMGILNVTPDSFSDGGMYQDADQALCRAEQMLHEGVDIVDVGGESTRPGAEPISASVEMDRVLPIVEKLAKRIDVMLSIDTSKAQVAQAALKAGAEMVNDVRAGADPAMFAAVKEHEALMVLMHAQGASQTMQDHPQYEDALMEVHQFLEQRMVYAQQAGLSKEKLLLDPGIGFGKNLRHNAYLLRDLSSFRKYGLPILVGASRKSMITQILGAAAPSERLYGTLGAHMVAVEQGASILRVHDVAAHVEMLKVRDYLQRHPLMESA